MISGWLVSIRAVVCFFGFSPLLIMSAVAQSNLEQLVVADDVNLEITVAGEYIVQRDSQSNGSDVEAFVAGELGAVNVAHIPNSTLSLVSVPLTERGWVNLNDYLALLEQAPGVDKAQPNYVRYPTASGDVLNDPMLPKQWYLDAINAKKAWQVNQDASDIIVAVIDSSIMIAHEDLKANLWTNGGEIAGNGKDDDGNGYIDDIHGWNFGNKTNDPSPLGACTSGHGTHVAGAIGAVGGNNKGVSGVAPKVQIMSLAVGRAARGCGLDSAGILEAINYAVANGAKIINLSLGGPIGASVAQATYQAASDKNVLLVIAAGNEGLSNDVEDIPSHSSLTTIAVVRNKKIVHQVHSPSYPAAFSRKIAGILSVANLQQNSSGLTLNKSALRRELKTYLGYQSRVVNGRLVQSGWLPFNDWKIGSSYGARSVHIGTPGTDIYSAVPSAGNNNLSAYKNMTGTSMASPITAGAAALVWSSFPAMTNLEVKARLLASVIKNPTLNGVVSSAGQLDVYQALCGNMFKQRAPGCDGRRQGKPQPPKSKPLPPVIKPPVKNKKPDVVPAPAKKKPPVNNTPPVSSKKNDDPNAWIRGENDEATDGGIEW